MGVPALFRWLSRKYPKIISSVIEEDANLEIGGAQYSDPNPNGEIDNLYLDMNGIVHPCSHPEHKPAPETEDEMFLDVFTYTDRVLMMARPRKVLMIAVDGVAPRAKMNQQRARRFRSAQDAKIAHEEKERQIKERELRGEIIDDAIKGKKSWDSNAITPGTPFMNGLALALRYWVSYKLATDPGWKNLQVIISDATVPGEGEHKLMNFIRSQRLDPEYDPNTKHCIYGLDADLIFLSLATHEPHFRVLREDVFANQSRQLKISDQLSMTDDQRDALKAQDAKKPFLWLHTSVLREYLEVELYNPRLSFPFDLERAIDDWVFMCFFVGNDFLPHLPSLDVRDNGIDILVGCWKAALPKLRDYVTCDGELNLESVEKVLVNLSYKEDGIFKKRHENETRREDNDKRRKMFQQEEKMLKNQYLSTVSKGQDKAPLAADVNMPLMTTSGENVDGFAALSNKEIVENRSIITKANMSNADAAAALKKLIDSKKNGTPIESEVTSSENPTDDSASKKRKLEDDDSPTPDANGDAVRNWENGYRERYYKTKFHCATDEEWNNTRRNVVRCYLEGISWVLKYYFQGCPSWNWYYPYHYAPFAADFHDMADVIKEKGIAFTLGQPFRPFEQLMSVLPAASGIHLPEVFQELMKNDDSEIIDFYPEDFQIDMNGAKMSWQGIPLLPFIDEDRLLAAVKAKYHLLTDDEHDRNTLKHDELYISHGNKNYERFLKGLYKDNLTEIKFRYGRSGLAGTASKKEGFDPEGITKFPLNEGDMPDLDNKELLGVVYTMPAKRQGKSMLLNGFISHDRALTSDDVNTILNGNRGGPRYRNTPDNSDYVNKGPRSKETHATYSLRQGGYRAFIEHLKNPQAFATNRAPNGYYNNNRSSNFNNRQNNYGQRNNYNNNNNNNGYNNNNYNNNGYNNGYNNSYNNNYNNNNYNNNNYNNNNNNYNNNYNNSNSNRGYGSASRSGYIPSPNKRGNYRGNQGGNSYDRY